MKDPVLFDRDRELWVAPIRHHSPACAAHLERLIEEVQPAAILVEGPCDFDPLIDLVCDSRTRAPVAIVSLREAGEGQATRRVASYFPFCAHSPELIALQAARARGIPARFIDLPSTAREMDLEEEAPREGRSLLGSERLFGVGDYVTALARELGARDGNEVWDQLFETRLAEEDWRRYFTDVARYCACIRAATSDEDIAGDGTLAREAQMRAIVDEVRAATDGPIVAVVGGFHAEVLRGKGEAKPLAAKAGAGRSYLIRYGMRQLDALRGYGAGLPLPGFYDRLWQMRSSGGAGLGMELITGFADHLRSGRGEAPSFPVIANAIEQAERLAALRGRPFPMRDDVIDAIRSSFIKEEIPVGQTPLLVELHAWLTGSAIGEVPPSAGSPPLVEAVRGQAKALGFSIADGEWRSRELDIYRKPRHRAASRFCHAMTLIGTSFAQRTGGPDFRNDVSLDRLHEIWAVCWSPLVEARLIELSEAADTLGEAIAFALAHRIAELAEQGKGRSALAAIDLFAAACRAGLGPEAAAILALIEEQVIEDPEAGSVVAALTDLLLLRRGREVLGIIETGPLDHLLGAAWRRLLVLLPELADIGADQTDVAVRTLSSLRGAIELARSAEAPIDLALFDEALDRLSARPLPPTLAGAVMAFSLLDGRIAASDLEARLKGELASAYVDPAERLAFLGGVIAIARELIWAIPAIIDAIDAIVGGVDEEEFIALLPYLRLALMPLDPREVDRLAEEVADRHGIGASALTVTVGISESEMTENLRLDRDLADLLARDCMA
ncbi:MAG: DUF5682 family protein [Sphingopyxis sp.]|uniref:DUF5682 family protein n=1 Tax=Sphingopyxis sp. TaxID=1908224 RepID=UPI003D6D927D